GRNVRFARSFVKPASRVLHRRRGGVRSPDTTMSKGQADISPRIANRRALHEYFIEAKLECGIALMGSEVKSLREGKGQLQESFVRVEKGQLILHGCHIDPYAPATKFNHEPLSERKLLAHRREIKKLEQATQTKGTTLIPLAMYFKGVRDKVEIGRSEE